MHYINTLKQELIGTKAYEQTSEKEKSVINNPIFHNATRFAVSVNEHQERLPTFYWLPTLHKQPYKARFIANSSSYTTTELSKLLTSCLTTIKNLVIEYCKKKVYERSGFFLLVGCVGFSGPLRQYFSLYRAVSEREGKEKKQDR